MLLSLVKFSFISFSAEFICSLVGWLGTAESEPCPLPKSHCGLLLYPLQRFPGQVEVTAFRTAGKWVPWLRREKKTEPVLQL